MINLTTIQRIYFIGIGGIGMSALARYFSSLGKNVSGYDRTETPLTKQLVSEGINVVYDDNTDSAPKDAELIVYTPAIPKDHPQLQFYTSNGYTLMKRSEVLGEITRKSFNICVAGTHGKTTVSTMIAHILRHSGYGCNAFLGGIAANYNSNFWSSERNVCVIEADEYDRSFLQLSPDIAVVTATDPDHLDIYGTPEAMQEAFVSFTKKIKPGGTLVSKKGLQAESRFSASDAITYSAHDKEADVYAEDIRLMNGYYLFNVNARGELIKDVALNMGGMHNVENATVAISIAKILEIETELVKDAIEDFKGVKRRFEYIIKTRDLVYIDDYAHHPEELATLINSAKKLFPGLKCTVIFQPHLFSRTKDFAAGFAESLDIADETILLPIYPARELPVEGVSSQLIAGKMKQSKVSIVEKKNVVDTIAKTVGTGQRHLLITAGAGDIDTLVTPIKNYLTTLMK